MKQKISDYIADFLFAHNITDVFTVTGGGAMHLNDAFGHHANLHCIYNHHEQACAMAAEAYAKYSQRMAAVCLTSGPGGTNAITGVLGAWLDSIPMIILSGQVKFSTTIKSTVIPLRQLGDQEFDIVGCVKNLTKFSQMIVNSNEVAYLLEKAFYLATHGRPGPVWLDIPLNIQAAVIETDELCHYEEPNEKENELSGEMMEEIINKIKLAERPVIIAGSAIRSSGAHENFIELLEKLKIPVVTAWNAQDVIWDTHMLYCGRPGTIGNRGGNFVVQKSDLLLILGCRLNIRQISYNWENFAPNAYKIMVDIDQGELLKPTLSIDYPICANVRDFIQSLNNHLKSKMYIHKDWLGWCKKVNKKYPVCLERYYNKTTPVNPYVFINELFQCLKKGDIVVSSAGSASYCAFQAAILKPNQRLFTNSGCFSMGYGLPAALGVSAARDNQRVICLEGDGSIQMNLQELQTIVHYNYNIKIFWLNNDGYHSIRQTQMHYFTPPLCGVSSQNGISFPSAERISQAYGIPFIKIATVMDIKAKIREALQRKGPVMIEIIIDSEQGIEPKLSAIQLPDGSMSSPSLENMSPFLQEEEMKDVLSKLETMSNCGSE